MTVLKLSYRAKDSLSRNLLNYTLSGRCVYANRRGKKVSYYLPGLLDRVCFKRTNNNSIYVVKEQLPTYYTDNDFKNFKDLFSTFGTMKIEETQIDDTSDFITAETHWIEITKKKDGNYAFIRRKNSK
jgi:hypothetical protein